MKIVRKKLSNEDKILRLTNYKSNDHDSNTTTSKAIVCNKKLQTTGDIMRINREVSIIKQEQRL